MTRLSAVAAAVTVALLLSACAATADDTASPAAAATTTAAPSTPSPQPSPTPDEPAAAPAVQQMPLSEPIEHVHGLVVDHTGAVRAGTHDGVRVIDPDGSVSAVGPRDDLMGMTGQPGTSRLVSSGHPGPASALPNPVGLISSDDGGATWQSRSLAGEVDFHALATTGEVIVGFDGVTGLLVSTDTGQTWQPGAPMAALSLAIIGDQVWATTPEGLMHSTDQAATFTPLDGAPLLWQIAAGTDSSLWGIDVDGMAWRSRDGLTWRKHQPVPPVEALATLDYTRAYAVNQTTLVALTG